jgi:hypothetical protein
MQNKYVIQWNKKKKKLKAKYVITKSNEKKKLKYLLQKSENWT